MKRIVVCWMVLVGCSVWVGAQTLVSRISSTELSLPQALEPNMSSFCTWDWCTIGPRLYLVPRDDGTLLAGWTDASGNGHVSVISGSSITTTHDFTGTFLRGVVAHSDGSFAVLLWDDPGDELWLSKRTAGGGETWSTSLNSSIARAREWLGGKRLSYGGGTYAAYFAVYGISGMYDGHWGDQLSFVDDSGAIQGGGWSWGCSHSMAELVGYHPSGGSHTAFCSSDCYPGKGLYRNHSTEQVYSGDGDCGGMVSVQLGQMAAAESGWKVLFNALDTAACEAYGIGLASAGGGTPATVTWLTNTDGSDERDPVIARIGTALPERYLVGWTTISDGAYHLAIVDGSGTFIEGPETLSGGISWGNRDDSLRSSEDGSVYWLQGTAGSATLTLYRYSEQTDLIFADGFESGDSESWTLAVP